MEFDKGTQAGLLLAVRDRLIDAIPELNESNCLMCDYELPAQLLDSLICTVSAGDGQFDVSLFAGGGHATLAEEITVSVALFRMVAIDRTDSTEQALIAANGFVSDWKPRFLRALLLDQHGNPWEPMHNGRAMLRDQLQPATYTAPRPLESGGGG